MIEISKAIMVKKEQCVDAQPVTKKGDIVNICRSIYAIICCIIFSTMVAMEKRPGPSKGGGETLDENIIIALTKDMVGDEFVKLCSVPNDDAEKRTEMPFDIFQVVQKVVNQKAKMPNIYRYFFDHVSACAHDEILKFTVLHCAVLLKLTDEVSLLLNRGANPDAKDYLGFSVLARALEQNAPKEIVVALLQSRGLLTTRLKSGASLARVASRVKNADVRKIVYAAIVEHQKKRLEYSVTHRNEKFIPDFECPLCERKAHDPFEFIDDECGHVVCAPCKAEFKEICPWCPIQKYKV